jgi:hypothetical protein
LVIPILFTNCRLSLASFPRRRESSPFQTNIISGSFGNL